MAMATAMPMRCSCFLSRPKNSPRSPPSDQLTRKLHFSGKMPHGSVNVGNFVTFCGDSIVTPSGRQNSLPVLKCQGNNETKFPVMAFLLANVFTFSVPLKVLAETCEAENSAFNMPILLSVSLIGATVGGLLARQRKGELKRLNEQLRQINAALRRQAKIESYAPTLSYAPVGGRTFESDVIVDPRKEELISRLKSGKNFLRNQDPEKAFLDFKTALELAQGLQDPIKEKKAARGLEYLSFHVGSSKRS
ncbi:protein FLUORESCENT IN BLUE LIGHT, chloroplastic-like isoform X2 [Cucurbita moschata]|uniref:Protein FLUORESCENT IN BLUE LIGHT, chloroplastic-like isoform X2 n=1 Tax=Cucurbita moschata TaxID=3662 RepID=A0A6J1GW34_CUCMO|nr:protein FLUORESCENT IN BLUE LIGHT, chloroplastic-like isoform X2 [Cucurbita moschata]